MASLGSKGYITALESFHQGSSSDAVPVGWLRSELLKCNPYIWDNLLLTFGWFEKGGPLNQYSSFIKLISWLLGYFIRLVYQLNS